MAPTDPLLNILWVLSFVLIGGGSLFWSLTEFRRHKSHLGTASIPHELRYQDNGDTASITGNIGPYQISVNTRLAAKYTKQQHVAVEASLRFTNAPAGFCLSPEGATTGIKRLGDQYEVEFDDPDFDNAFWVQAKDPDALREYLDENRRKALLHWLRRMGDGVIENGVLTRTGIQGTGMDSVGSFLGQFLGLSYAFQGDQTYHASTAELESGWVANQRLRRLAWWTGLMALGFWILPLEVHLPEWIVKFDYLLVVFSAATAVFAVVGRRTVVVVLCAVLGCLTSLALLAAGVALLMQAHYWTGSFVLGFALIWFVSWIGTTVAVKSLKA